MLSIIIPTRNKLNRLKLCIKSLDQNSDQINFQYEVIIVDDASDDGTFQWFKGCEEITNRLKLKYIKFYSCKGRSVARNIGAENAKGNCLLFMDDDILIPGEMIKKHYEICSNVNSKVFARGAILHLPWLTPIYDPMHPEHQNLPKMLLNRLKNFHQRCSLIKGASLLARRSRFEFDLQRLLSKTSEEIPGRWIASTGGNLSFPKHFFEKIGGFDSNMGKDWGCEDLELGYRAEKEGALLKYIASPPVFHLDHPKQSREVEHQKSLDYFIKKHGKAGSFLQSYFNGSDDILKILSI